MAEGGGSVARGGRPLSGVRVLDLSRLLPGPFASLVLADMGALVDKVEDPGGGDYLRHMPPQVAGANGAFHALNRGKRNVVLDLKHAKGRDTFLRLVAGYDVLLEQFRPGVLDRLGLGHAALRERFPRLVICALTGYGQTGPLAKRAGHDLNYLARAGLLGFQGPAGAPPAVPGWQLADISGGLWCVVAILGALRERDRSGTGAVLDIAMVDSVIGFASTAFGALFAAQPPQRGAEALSGGIAPYSTYLTSDGEAMALAALEPKFWASFCEGVRLPFEMSAFLAGPHQEELKGRVAALFRQKTRAEWEAFAATRDCCLEPVLRPDELLGDAHLRARELFFELPVGGAPVGQYRTPVTPRDQDFTPPAESGADTDRVLAEAGFSPAEIAELRAAHVVR
jgi:alpha-methylacyl-CoA racemase